MAAIRADRLRIGGRIVFPCGNGKTIGRIFRIEDGDGEIGLCLDLASPVAVPDMPGRKTHYWPLWAAPDEMLELYI